ncbi:MULTISPECIES: DUF3889 domain-containing protein [Paenibacillus]|uniref:DUF3889 domain-containing protein n=1 Tax=Paenibacillus TaxID=44249 RepID=UPI0022B909EC|nr:DUF3889 domain-containing protein [Paenibacillus caseinilyticus]MCZ8520700.1 DUF3889 domain-containing protein [Paenibacillus caseinilyticus]
MSFKRVRIGIMAAALLCGVWLPGTGVQGRPAPKEEPKAAFIRSGHLWLKQNGQERELTAEGSADTPRWSADGQYVAYTRRASAEAPQGEVWVYSLETDRHHRVYVQGGSNYRWSPKRSVLALQLESVLGTVEVGLSGAGSFTSEAVGVGNYAWLPDGSGFLISSAAQLNPAGWSAVELFTVPLHTGTGASAQPRLLFTLPLQSGDFFAVGTSTFKWSEDGRWISFIARPTASWSADSNTLCLLSADGKVFRKLGHMLGYEPWFHWAPRTGKLGYIEGEGRLVTQNKRLEIREMGAFRTQGYTPAGFADRGFTWLDDKRLAVSRSEESGEDTEEARRPLPALFRVPASSAGPGREQIALTRPPEGFGDYAPSFIRRTGKLAWVRSDGQRAEAWISDEKGAGAAAYIKGLDTGTPYYGYVDWSRVLAWYDPEPVGAGTALLSSAAVAGIPSYAPWGRIAMQETAKKYGAEIHDYLYVGRKAAGPNLTEDTFKLWVVKEGHGFGVIVRVRWETATERLQAVEFEETDR